MAFDGNGNWVSNFSAEADRDAGYKILASRFDNIFIADIASSFENCLTKDAQVKPIQAFDVNNNKIINLANPTNNNDAVNLTTLNSKDGTAVHKSGTETITGNKTFSGSNTFSGATTFSGNITSSGTNTFTNSVNLNQSGTSGGFVEKDTGLANNSTTPSADRERFYREVANDGSIVGQVQFKQNTGGEYIVSLLARRNVSGTNKNADMGVVVDASGNIRSFAPAPAATNSTSEYKIATTGWVNDPSKSTNVVHRSGNETADGNKTFTGYFRVKQGGSSIVIERGSSTYTEVQTQKSDSTRTGGFRNITDNGNSTLIYATDTAGTTIKSTVAAVWDGTNAYATAPTPPSATDNSTKIATTAWVRNHRCTTAATTTSTASVDAPAYVVENYKNGANWYRVWSDGWIEQGTSTSYLGDGGSSTWTFLKPFADTNYTICLGAYSAGNYSTYKIKDSKTTTSVKLYQQGINGSASANVCAYACGY